MREELLQEYHFLILHIFYSLHICPTPYVIHTADLEQKDGIVYHSALYDSFTVNAFYMLNRKSLCKDAIR